MSEMVMWYRNGDGVERRISDCRVVPTPPGFVIGVEDDGTTVQVHYSQLIDENEIKKQKRGDDTPAA